MNFIRIYFAAIFALLSTSAHSTLMFSEYVEGSGYNKALEIFNIGDTIDFDSDSYAIEIYTNGSTSASYTLNLSGTVTQNSTFVVGHSRASAPILSASNQLSGRLNFNGDDAIVLVHHGVIVDRIGQIGFDPGAEWGAGGISTQDNTLRRHANVSLGDVDASSDFDPALQWVGFAQDSFEDLGQHSITDVPGSNPHAVSVPAPGSLVLILVGMLGLLLTRQPGLPLAFKLT
jgi:predicted extracellular nuclease